MLTEIEATEQKATHTPGPWEAHLEYHQLAGDWFEGTIYATDRSQRTGPFGRLAVVDSLGNEDTVAQAHANTHLIAASPELLEALRDLVKCCEVIGTFDNGIWHEGQCEGEVIAGRYLHAARLAILKAEGKETTCVEGRSNA